MDFIRLISAERFNAYRISDDENENAVINRYLWNAQLCSAFYVPLHFVEIGLRNSLFNSISERYGQDWLIKNILHEREQNSTNDAISELKKRNEPCHTGKIIAELSFGFWGSLLYQKYDAPSFKDKTKAVFWPYCIKNSFPYMHSHFRTRRHIEKKIEKIKRFRNRIFHHEPIWKTNLNENYKDILEVISWFYKDYEKLVSIDRVKELLNQKQV